jgi:hypothetical protein
MCELGFILMYLNRFAWIGSISKVFLIRLGFIKIHARKSNIANNYTTSKNNVTFDLPYSLFNTYQLRLTIITFFLLFITQGQAQQLSFNKTKVEQGYSFKYQWLDHNKVEQAISFTLNQEGLFDRFRNFKTYQNSYAQKTILRRIKREMQRNPIAGVQIFYRQQHDNFLIKVNGLDSDKVAKSYQTLTRIESEVTQQYLQEIYYQAFTNHEQINGIKVDHVSIANNSVADLKSLKPLILDHVSIQDIRKVTNYVLSFVQSIP